MTKKIFVISFFLMLSFSGLYSQTVVDIKNDTQFVGLIINETADSIAVKTFEGVAVHIPKTEIEDQYEVFIEIWTKLGNQYRGKLIDFNDSLYRISSQEIEYNIPVNSVSKIGVFNDFVRSVLFDNMNTDNEAIYSSLNFGLGINLIWAGSFLIGYDYNNFGSRFSLSIIPLADVKCHDIRLSCLYNLGRKGHFEHNLSLGLGHLYKSSSTSSTYTGLFYDISLYNFFLEGGIYFPIEDENPNTMIQFGYIYRFND